MTTRRPLVLIPNGNPQIQELPSTDSIVGGTIGPPGMTWKGAWSAATNYAVDDAVSDNGSSYIAIAANTNQEPPNATYWNLLASKGDTGATGAKGDTGATGPAGAAGTGVALLEQHTASSSASLDFTTCISSTYDDYLIEILSIVPATSGVSVNLLVSTNGGTSYATTSYQSVLSGAKVSTGGYANAQSTTAIMLVNAFGTGVTRAALSGSVRMQSPAAATNKFFVGQVVFPLSTDSSWYGLNVSGVYDSASAVNAFQIKASSGNITSGTVRVYGIAKS